MNAQTNVSSSLKTLTPDQIAYYEEQGYLPSVEVMSAERAAECLTRLETFESQLGMKLSDKANFFKYKSHLLFTWMNDLIRTPVLLDAVEDVLGTPNILVRATDIFVKEPHDPSFVSFHQDATYWGLSTPKVLTAWIALTPSNESNGVLKVIPGTHKQAQMPHVEKHHEHNMLTNSQEVQMPFSEDDAVALSLEPGRASLHNYFLVHGSNPNQSAARRIGVAVRYMSTDVKPTHDKADYATLVRGQDDCGYFQLEKAPKRDVDPESIKLMQQYRAVMTATSNINFANNSAKNS